MLYTIQITVKVAAETEREATRYIKAALEHSRMQDIDYIDSEVIEAIDDSEDYDDSPLDSENEEDGDDKNDNE